MSSFTVNPAVLASSGSWSAEAEFPNECPLCHYAIVPIFAAAFATTFPPVSAPIEIIFRCPRGACQHAFVAACEVVGSMPSGNAFRYEIRELKPRTPNLASFDDIIGRVSPAFITIYNQAMAAESYNLDQIVGIGLRKSLEFLIKDYIVQRNPDHHNAVERKQLAQCIGDHVEDDMLKECARRAAWLGNDETHYVRKWTEHDIGDLKKLIRLTVLWIERAEYTAEYIRGMPEAGPPPPP